MTEPKAILTIHEGGHKIMQHEGALPEALYHAAANHLTGDQRLELIEKLQANHAALESRFR